MPPVLNLPFIPENLLLSGIFAAILLFFALLFFLLGRLLGRFEAERRVKKLLETERRDAVKRSRAVLGGQLNEQIAPCLPGFPANAADARFVGKPVDFICFCGLSDSDTVSEILFIEVKTGNSTLSKREKEVKKAVEEGRIRYVEYKIR